MLSVKVVNDIVVRWTYFYKLCKEKLPYYGADIFHLKGHSNYLQNHVAYTGWNTGCFSRSSH